MRECPKCQHEMVEDCYLHDTAQPMTQFIVIEKDENFKKIKYPLKVAICKTCGHIEFYADIKE